MSEIDSNWEKYAKAADIAKYISFMGTFSNVLRWQCQSSNGSGVYLISRVPSEAIGGCDWLCSCKDFEIKSQEHVSYQCKHIMAVHLSIVNSKVNVLLTKKSNEPSLPPEWIILSGASGSIGLRLTGIADDNGGLVTRLRQIAANKKAASINLSMKVSDFESVEHHLSDSETGSFEELSICFGHSEMSISEVFIG